MPEIYRFIAAVIVTTTALGIQPKVDLTHDEPAWPDLLKQQWGLDMDRDLRNPLIEGVEPAALFQRIDKDKPVTFTPIIALGMETTTRGGWYVARKKENELAVEKKEIWAYTYKQSQEEMKSGKYTIPPLDSGSCRFEPGDQPFGLWVSNDQLPGVAVYTQPSMTRSLNSRPGMQIQPYKAMIYPYIDPEKKRLVPDSYLIGWEYSFNDDFQDVVTRIDNVKLLPSEPVLKGVIDPDAGIRKLAGGFKFVEGPAWDHKNKVLYFSDIPPEQIIRYSDGKADVANDRSGGSNGLMFDKEGMLIACEHQGRRISRAVPGQPATTIVSHYRDKKLNSPNDLWLDADGGIYFTDPRYGRRDDLEQDREAVYYVSADGQINRIIDDLVRPNGIALSPDGKTLYVIDNGDEKLYSYPILGPGKIGRGRLIAYIQHPDGMAVDAEGRLYMTSHWGIAVLRPDGKWTGWIDVPEVPANCTFGGPDNNILFITARNSLYAIDTLTRGWHFHLDGAPGR